MPFYRVIWIGDERHIAGPVIEIDCPNDAAAVRTARKLSGGRPVELWHRGRLVSIVGDGHKMIQPPGASA
jgi:hypothetical protein